MKKFQGGGGVPRQTTIGGQRHDLAYINPFEADLLRAYGGSGEPGPGGVPAYRVYNSSYNPSTISRDRTQSTASRQQAAMDREIQRDDTPRPAEETTAQARARMDKGSNQGPTPAQAAAAQAAAAAAAQAAAAARGQAGRDAAAAAAAKVGAPMTSAERQREIAARVPTYNVGPASMRGLTSRQGPSSGGIMDTLRNIPIIGGVISNYQMGITAGGPLTSLEEQYRNLVDSGKYTKEEIEEYMAATRRGIARQEEEMFGGGARPAGDDSMPYTLPAAADPCPEGYRMDTVTNACVPADDVTGGTPPVVPGFPDLTRPDPVAVPTVVGSSDYTQMPVTGGVPPLLPGVVPMPEIAGPVNRGFMPSEYGGLLGIAGPDARFTTGMPTDIDPFR